MEDDELIHKTEINHFEEKDGEKISKTIIVGDKISFLAAQKTYDKKDEIEMD